MKMNKLRLLSAVITCGMLSGCAGDASVGEPVNENIQTEETTAVSAEVSEMSEITEAAQGEESFADTDGIIELSDSGINISGNGASAEGSVVTISQEGDYLISGTLTNGRIIVDAPKTANVKLILNGVSVTSEDGAALYVKCADKAVIYLANGSENVFTDGKEYILTEDESGIDACIYSKDDIKIKGEGSLQINGNSEHGIHSKNDIMIESGNISVTAVNDGIKGKDSVEIAGGNIAVVSGGDGICSDNSEEAGKGYVSVSAGSISVVTGGGSAAAVQKKEDFFNFRGEGADNSSSDTEENISCKGIKSAAEMEISGGTFVMDCCDDAFHSDKTLTVTNGTITVSTGDDAFHAGEALILQGGNAEILKCYEGLEGMSISLSGGSFSVIASDDGVNAAGGSDDESASGRRQDMFASNDNNNISITGGYLYVNAEGDGIDSNGNMDMSGGEVYVDGPVNSGNGALDFGGSFNITGGTLAAAGSSGMVQSPSDSSEQKSLFVFFDSKRSAGTVISLKNSSGEEILSCTPAKEFQCILFSSEKLNSCSEVTVCENGEALCTSEMSSSVTKINEKGEASDLGNGMGGGFGGMGGRGDRESFKDKFTGEKPQRPEGDFPQDGEFPQPPEGDFPQDGEFPQPPQGELPQNGEPPQTTNSDI